MIMIGDSTYVAVWPNLCMVFVQRLESINRKHLVSRQSILRCAKQGCVFIVHLCDLTDGGRRPGARCGKK